MGLVGILLAIPAAEIVRCIAVEWLASRAEKSDAVIGFCRMDDDSDVSPRMYTRPRNDSRRAKRHLLILFHSRDLGHAFSLQDCLSAAEKTCPFLSPRGLGAAEAPALLLTCLHHNRGRHPRQITLSYALLQLH